MKKKKFATDYGTISFVSLGTGLLFFITSILYTGLLGRICWFITIFCVLTGLINLIFYITNRAKYRGYEITTDFAISCVKRYIAENKNKSDEETYLYVKSLEHILKLLDEKGLTVEEYSTINFNKEGEIANVEHNDNN